VVNRHGRWYVAGYDTDRDAARVFRLSRIEGEVGFTGPAGSVIVPEGTDVRETVREWDTQPPVQQRAAVLRVRQGAGYGIRRYATPVPGSTDVQGSIDVPGSTDVQGGTDGWETISVPFSDVGWFAEHLASFGTDVVALEPADLREAVITQLKGALA
jgi:proteasome accessory factor B